MYELCNEQLTMFLLRASIHPSVSRVLATVRWTGGGDAIFFQNRTFPSSVSFLSSSSRVPYFFFHETAQYESTRGVAESGSEWIRQATPTANGGIRRVEGARLAVMAVKRGGEGRRIASHARRGSRRGHLPPRPRPPPSVADKMGGASPGNGGERGAR